MGKRLLSFVLAAAIALLLFPATTFAFTDTDGTKYETAVNVLSALGFVKGYPDNTFDYEKSMTRAELAYIAFRVGSTEEEAQSDAVYWADVQTTYWAKAYINYVTEYGYMEGAGQFFFPDSTASLEDVCKVLVRMLGYDFMTSVYDYVSIAGSIGLTKGLSSVSNPPGRGDIAVMVYQALLTDLAEVNSVKNPDSKVYSSENGKTLLSTVHKIYKGTGQVTAVQGMNLSSSNNKLAENEIKINNVSFQTEAPFDKELLGYELDYFYQEASEDVYTLIYYTIEPRCEVDYATSSSISSKSDLNTFYYDNGEKQTSFKSVALNAAAKFVRNGRVISDSSKSDKLFTMESGDVKVITPRNGMQVVVINNYDYYRIDSVGSASLFLVKSTDPLEATVEIELDEQSDTYDFEILSDGEEISLSDLQPDIAVAVSRGADAKEKPFIRIIVLNDTVSGTIQAYSDDSITVADKDYPAISGLNGADLDGKAVFYLNQYGEIAVIVGEKSTEGLQYAVLLKTAVSKSLESKFEMRVLNTDNIKSVLTAKDKFDLNGETVKPGSKLSEKLVSYGFTAANGDPNYQLIAYSLNENGTIKELYNAYEGETAASDNKLYLSKASASYKYKGGNLGIFNAEYYCESDIYFSMPNPASEGYNPAAVTEDDFVCYDRSFFQNDSSYTLAFYNMTDYNAAKVTVLYTAASSGATITYDSEQRTNICNRVTKALDEDGVETYCIEYYSAGVLQSKLITQTDHPEYAKTMERASKMKRGDQFLVVLTGDTKYIKYLTLEYSAENRTEKADDWNSGRGIIYGKVIARGGVNDVVIKKVAFDASGTEYIDNSRSYAYRNIGGVNVYIYHGDRFPIEKAPASTTVKVGDYLTVRTRYGLMREIVVFRD